MIHPKQNRSKNLWTLLPLAGSLLFVLLYIAATCYYPGGSQADVHAKGFSWAQNYWCNLLNERAMNGQPNAARPIALMAMLVLASTLLGFWTVFPAQANLQKGSRRMIQFAGIACVATGLFIFTNRHDLLITVASFFGLIAIAGTFAGLRKLKWLRLFWFGVFNVALVALNNVLYYGTNRYYLPAVQKITFFTFLLWIGLIAFYLYQKRVH